VFSLFDFGFFDLTGGGAGVSLVCEERKGEPAWPSSPRGACPIK